MITWLGEEVADLCASHALFVYSASFNFCPFFSSSWCQGFAAACNWGTPCTFLLTYFITINQFVTAIGAHELTVYIQNLPN